MRRTDLNWKNGKVLGWDIDDLDLDKSLESQLDLLKEDLILVKFGQDINLGLGWLPEFNPEGQFVMDVVKLEDWENPVFQLKFRDLREFMQNLNQAIEAASCLASN